MYVVGDHVFGGDFFDAVDGVLRQLDGVEEAGGELVGDAAVGEGEDDLVDGQHDGAVVFERGDLDGVGGMGIPPPPVPEGMLLITNGLLLW